MRKIVLSLVTAGAALIAASPASAQYYPGPPPATYGYGYGVWGQVRALQARLDAVERQIGRLDRRDVIRNRTADRLHDEADRIERRLHSKARDGLSPREAADIEVRIGRLEQRIQYAANNRDYWDRDRDRF